MIDCYYWPTPNGKKVTILLEELGIDYQIVPCDIGRGDQFSDGFLDISPNNRMPAMVDHDPVPGLQAGRRPNPQIFDHTAGLMAGYKVRRLRGTVAMQVGAAKSRGADLD